MKKFLTSALIASSLVFGTAAFADDAAPATPPAGDTAKPADAAPAGGEAKPADAKPEAGKGKKGKGKGKAKGKKGEKAAEPKTEAK